MTREDGLPDDPRPGRSIAHAHGTAGRGDGGGCRSSGLGLARLVRADLLKG